MSANEHIGRIDAESEPGGSGGNDFAAVSCGPGSGPAARLVSIDAQSTTASTDPTEQSLAMDAEGRIHLDVVVRDASGNPVTGLQARDFSLIDKGKPQKIVSFTAFGGGGALWQVTVAQLTATVESLKEKHDVEAAKEINHLRLTERLSSPKLATLSAQLPGPQSTTALMAVGDASAFLKPPLDEVPEKAPPDLAEQRQMMSQAVDYLKKVIPKLPDFYANRLTTSFEEASTPKQESNPSVLQPAGEFKATVYYRGGKEVVHAEGAEEFGLTTEGTFGPILSTVVVDAAHSTTEWSRWEEGPNGPIAVFRFQVPQAKSHYQASFSTFATGDLGAAAPTAYHGEFGIDPHSGTILRLVLQADADSDPSMRRADIMVEYGAVMIGGKGYTCPVRIVSIAAGASPMKLSATLQVTRLDDIVFSGYHIFRSDFRILPSVPEDFPPASKKEKTPIVQ